ARELYLSSQLLSKYIRLNITEQRSSIWLAQRQGRTKNGYDITEQGLLKMLDMSGKADFKTNFEELNIVPVAITYEYDPCDALKGYQFQLKRDQSDYKKSKNEDLTHMSTGLSGRKGRVHFAFGKPINSGLDAIASLPKNEQVAAIAELIDRQIYANYHLCANSYIALDAIEGTDKRKAHYTAEQKDEFLAYADKKIAAIEGADHDYVLDQMLHAYANPLINQEKTLGA
ncbi:MAG: acyltransferase, partial [Bacteroidales bacterium]|nr:acyltransferase [Bacteroidales bacterium]